MTETVNENSYQGVWGALSKIDVTRHIEKKNGLSYLSWAWAWGVLMREYPHAEYYFPDAEVHGDGTVTVFCTVRIGPCERTMWLPVMDHRNNAIKNPDARKISDTKMRCLVKCLAMFGLGHYIYAGEDINSNAESLAEPSAGLSDAEIAALNEKPEKVKKPTKQGFTDIPDEAGALEMAGKLLELANQFCVDEAGLKSFWKSNKQMIDIIDTNYPAQYEILKKGFIELKNKFGENTNG